MFAQVDILCKLPATNIALVFAAISAMNCFHMTPQVVLLRELSAANLELVTSFGAACMSDVVSADLQYVAERHVTKLALYVTRLPNLLT